MTLALKPTPQGLLIHVTMTLYLLALVMTLLRAVRPGRWIFALGFVTGLSSFIYRWIHVAHWPMQNLFEVFVTLGMLCYPASMLCRRYLRVGGHAGDMLIGAILMFPAGFVFKADPQHLPPVLQSHLFAPHVAVYMIGYVLMAKACLCGLAQLIKREPEQGLLDQESATYVMVCLGFPFITLGLILGSWWGKLAWGNYWGWDPKELWSLATWLVYLGYFHVRTMFGSKRPRLNSTLAILGMVFILITLLWVNLSKIFAGLHNYAT